MSKGERRLMVDNSLHVTYMHFYFSQEGQESSIIQVKLRCSNYYISQGRAVPYFCDRQEEHTGVHIGAVSKF